MDKFVKDSTARARLILMYLDLDVQDLSICINEADQSFADSFVDAFGELVPIAKDFEGTTTACLDVGAFDSLDKEGSC